MAKKKAIETEVAEVANEEVKVTPAKSSDGYEVADRYKDYSSFIVNGVLIPVVDGKVTVGGSFKDMLMKQGYLK